jgi:dTDP-4-amino-4,6-dideoxygalactose transaminase
MDTIKVPFNKPFNFGSELLYIAQSVINGHTAGDGPFGRKCEAILESMLGFDSNVLLTTSCTSALEIAAMQIEIENEDEFILPSYTFVSTANAFCLRRGRPIFADIDPYTLNINIAHAESLITNKTKSIIPVHYAGISCDMDELLKVASKNSLKVIEDAAQAICSTYKGKPLGTFGDFATFSFHETKNIICGEGGALVIKGAVDKERSEIIREKGTDRAQFFRGQIDKYTWRAIGSSYVLSDLSAAFLFAQLEHANEIQNRRMEAYVRYTKRLKILEINGHAKLPFIPEYNTHNAHIFYLILENKDVRTNLIKFLKSKGILAVFHYMPLHTSPMGESYGYKKGMLPVTERISDCLLRLPLCSAFDLVTIDYVSDMVIEFFGK